MMFKRLMAAGGTFAIVLALAGCATTSVAPLNAPAPLSITERMGDVDVPFSSVIEAAGRSALATGSVARGSSIVSFPYRYRHTAVLTEDVIGFSITVRGVQAPAGAPGYYVGTFAASGTYGNGAPAELWCFLPAVVGGSRESLCLLKNQPAIAAIAPTRMNPWLWTQFAPATGSFDYVNTPIYERREVVIPGDLTVDYRFAGWTRNGARVELRVGGREVQTTEVLRTTAGVAVRLRTVAGDFDLSPDPTDPDRLVAKAV